MFLDQTALSVDKWGRGNLAGEVARREPHVRVDTDNVMKSGAEFTQREVSPLIVLCLR